MRESFCVKFQAKKNFALFQSIHFTKINEILLHLGEEIMFIVLYRWRIKPEKETQFIKAWAEVTDYFRQNWDSLGSRLHRGNDGLFYGYAQWKSASDRENAFANAIKLEASELMKDAIAESFEPIILEKLADFLVLPEK